MIRPTVCALLLCVSTPVLAQQAQPAPPPVLPGDAPPPPPAAPEAPPGDVGTDVKPAFAIPAATATASATATTSVDASAEVHAEGGAAPKMISRRGAQLARQDVEPTVPVLHTDNVDLRVGGLVQLHLAPYVGDDSLVQNGDPATRAGFRVRRARFGFEALFSKGLGMLIAVNPLETDEDIGVISNAMITYQAHPAVFVSAGTVKVPFARGSLESSRRLLSIERALSVQAIAPVSRLGVTLEGRVLDGRIGYIAGYLNGTEGYSHGNEYGGFLTGARLEVAAFGDADVMKRDATGVTIGGGGLYADEPATKGYAWSADVVASAMGAGLRVEALCDKKEPQDAPVPSPAVPDAIRRCGMYGELSYVLPEVTPKLPVIQPAVRVDFYDDNRNLEDAGDVMVISGGLNADLAGGEGRFQLMYLARRERHGIQRANDGIYASLQGAF